jgi:hypothetical protein
MVYSDIYLRSLISGAGFTTGCFVAVFVLLGIVVGLFGTNLLRINFKTTVEEESEDEDQLESEDRDDNYQDDDYQDDDYQDSQDDDSQDDDSQDDDSQDDYESEREE